jgi:hypothetical protein
MMMIAAILVIILLSNFFEGFLRKDILWLRLMPFVALMLNVLVEVGCDVISQQPIRSLGFGYLTIILCGFMGFLIILHYYALQRAKQEESENV